MSARGRLRILFLAPQPFFEVRGTPLAVRAMLEALGELGHQVDLLTYPQGEDQPLPGVRHRRSLPLPVGRVRPGPSLGKTLLDVPFMAQAAALMATRRYDVVHAVEEAAHLAAPLARLFRVPLVMDVDSSIPDQMREGGFATRGPLLWLAERLERHALRHSAAVITVCASLSDSVRARAPRARVHQIEDPPLVDGAEAVDPERMRALRASLGLEPEDRVVLYTGNLEPYQGVDLLLDAAALLPGVRFVIVGGDPRHVAEAAARAARQGAAARVVFCGPRPTADLPGFLALADIVASPRVTGLNTPFKIYTYMASGKPIVATRIASHTQVLDDTTAFLVDPEAPALAAGIRRSLEERGEARRRADAARDRAGRDYSRARFREKVQTAYAHFSLEASP
ncbi:MAG TPA: glycosyltransferase [Vicinamibacteria bacterium]